MIFRVSWVVIILVWEAIAEVIMVLRWEGASTVILKEDFPIRAAVLPQDMGVYVVAAGILLYQL